MFRARMLMSRPQVRNQREIERGGLRDTFRSIRRSLDHWQQECASR